MLTIRLTRKGRRHRPFYRIVVADSRRARDGRFIEVLGHYDPAPKPAAIKLDTEKIEEWVARGAKLSDTVRSLLKQAKKKDSSASSPEAPEEAQQEVKQ
jgi:small subunit ribosomal protein S16